MDKSNYFPKIKEFKALSETANLVPVYREVLADTDTPVSAFLKIDDGKEAFLLESVVGGSEWGRFSFLGTSPRAVIRSLGTRVEIIEEGETKTITGDPLEVLKDYLSSFTIAELEGAPRFPGGAIGYVGYDIVRHIERLPDTSPRDLDLYDLFFIITDTFLVFDNVLNKIKVISNASVGEGVDAEAAYKRACEEIEKVVEKLRCGTIKKVKSKGPATPVTMTSNFKKEDFFKAVEDTKEYIRSGDIIQTVISQRFESEFSGEPFDIYRALRVINPSPYMFFMRLGGIELAGSSPEILVRNEGSEVTVRPIAGTRPRGLSDAEDKALEKELLADEKERAEHIMLVDLGRNDLGRISKAGTVEVDELMTIERYSHVMHIVSNVRGEKMDDKDSFDVLRACFPAGTLSGAPKIRAMEIIEELEPCKRGVYGGSLGYFSFSGNMDVCITIRTVLIKDNRVYLQAGAGIVADSEPEKEYEETVNKAKGMLKAVEMASKGFN